MLFAACCFAGVERGSSVYLFRDQVVLTREKESGECVKDRGAFVAAARVPFERVAFR